MKVTHVSSHWMSAKSARKMLSLKHVGLGILLGFFVPLAVLADGEVPYTFQAGEPVPTDELNANFEALSSDISELQRIVSPHMKVFTSSGTFTVPPGVNSVIVELWGGGGKGGNGANCGPNGSFPGANGGGGGYGKGGLSVSPGYTYAVTVGGSGQTSAFSSYFATAGATGSNGGCSQFPTTSGAGGTSNAPYSLPGKNGQAYPGFGSIGAGGAGSTSTGANGQPGLVILYY